MPARPALAILTLHLLGGAASPTPAAEPPKPVPAADLDRLAVEVLKDVHNRGADLYNAADAAGAYRLYEGALRGVGPFLKHRPKAARAIADGLAEVAKLPTAKEQAFRLHEVIEQVRADLKADGPHRVWANPDATAGGVVPGGVAAATLKLEPK